MHIRDQGEGNGNGDSVRVHGEMRKALQVAYVTDQARDHRLTDPAQRKTDHRDAQLHAVYNFIQIGVQALDDTGADSSGFNQLLDACIADTHERKFSRREERVRRYQKQDQKDPEQH